MMLPVPPVVTMPTASPPSASAPCMRSRVMAMISPSSLVALGNMSRWRMLAWAKSWKASPMKA